MVEGEERRVGMLVECDGVTVWDAGMVSARLFAGQVRLLEEVFGLDSGMIGPEADAMYVDARRWREFARALLEQLHKVDSPVPHAMVAGIVQLVLVVDARASRVWLDVPPRFVHLRHGAEGLQHSMAGDSIAIDHHPPCDNVPRDQASSAADGPRVGKGTFYNA